MSTPPPHVGSIGPEPLTPPAGSAPDAAPTHPTASFTRIAVPAAIFLSLISAAFIGGYMERGICSATFWVDHTYQVSLELQRYRAFTLEAESDRSLYLMTGSPTAFTDLQTDIQKIWNSYSNLRHMTSDNPAQQARLNELDSHTTALIAHLQTEATDSNGRALASPAGIQATTEMIQEQEQVHQLLIAMRAEENSLLDKRQAVQRNRLRQIFELLLLLVIIGLVLTAIYLRMMYAEVQTAKRTQKVSQESAESFRALSAKILELQDKERRRVARELHDSVGQYLAVLRMNLDRIKDDDIVLVRESTLISDTLEIADNAIAEVRTISHLLHPPMLEEIGLGDAIIWYVEQFSQRSGMKVTVNVPDKFDRLPRAIELGLFRSLQESLTNVHRHSGAQAIEVSLARVGQNVVLVVTDNGKGIPRAVLSRFQRGAGGGVGLAGMRERIAELGGELQVQSNSQGTMLRAVLPAEFVDPVRSSNDSSDSG